MLIVVGFLLNWKQNKQFGFYSFIVSCKTSGAFALISLFASKCIRDDIYDKGNQMLIEKLHRVHRILNAFQMNTVDLCMNTPKNVSIGL